MLAALPAAFFGGVAAYIAVRFFGGGGEAFGVADAISVPIGAIVVALGVFVWTHERLTQRTGRR